MCTVPTHRAFIMILFVMLFPKAPVPVTIAASSYSYSRAAILIAEHFTKDEGSMSKNTGERIGEGLIRIGAIKTEAVDDVLSRQAAGDKRLFGEIAIDLGYIDDQAIKDYLESKG